MGLFDWISKGLNRAVQNVYTNIFQSKWTQPPRYPSNQYLELFHTSPRLDTLRMIADDVSSTPWKLYSKSALRADIDASPLKVSPLYELLENPMPSKRTMDFHTLIFLTVVYRRLTGDAFWLIERNGRGEPAELYPVVPTWVIGTPTETSPFFRVTPFGVTGGLTISVNERDMVWFKSPNVLDPFGRGRGIEESIGDEMQSDEYAAKWAKNLFFNDATPPYVISAPGIDKAGADRFMEGWQARFGGYSNAHKPAVLGFDAKFQKLTDSAREMDFTESRKMLRDLCIQHFAVPPEMLGILENSNRSTIDAADYFYKKNVLSRDLCSIESVITRQLCSEFDSDCQFCFDNVIVKDESFLLMRATQGIQARAITINEWRKANGWKAIEGGDELPRAPAPPTVSEGDKPAEDSKPEKNDKPIPPAKSFQKIVKGTDKAIHWADFDKTAKAGEAGFVSAVEKIARKQRVAVQAAYNSARDSGLSIDAAMDKAISEIYGSDADKMVANGLAPEWISAMKAGFELAERVIGGGISFDIVKPAFEDWVKENGYAQGKLINETSVSDLRKMIQEGIAAGDGTAKISARIQSVYTDLAGYRADTIARTETCASVNFGQLETYAAEGVKKKQWIATQDGKERPEHDEAQDQGPIPIEEAWDVGGYRMMFPGDSNAGPEMVCNCRCTMISVDEEE